MARFSRLCRCAVGLALGVAVLLPASRAEASERTYHAFQYNILGGINGGSQFNASVQLLEYKLRQHASDPPVVVTAQEVCERQAFHIMTVALSVVSDYDYSFWPEKTEGTEGCNGREGNLLLTRGTPYGDPNPYFYPAQSSTDYGLTAFVMLYVGSPSCEWEQLAHARRICRATVPLLAFKSTSMRLP